MADVELHIATNGYDGASGTKDEPFATLERARDEIRLLKKHPNPPTGAITVVIHSGTYYLNDTFRLFGDDSGSDDAPIIYRSAGDGGVILSGGREVSDFGAGSGDVQQADVSSLGLHRLASEHTDPIQPFELFFDDERMDLARWPSHDASDPYDGQWAYISGIPKEGTYTQFHYAGDTPSSWTDTEGAQVHIFPNYDWADQFIGVESIDPKNSLITLKDRTRYDLQPGRRFYIRGVFEALDSPKEWYFDRNTDTLFFLPPKPISNGSVVISYLDHVISLEHTSHVVFEGLTFQHSRSHMVTITGGSNNTISKSGISNIGGFSAQIDGGTNNALRGCDITQTGRGGVMLSGGDRPSLTPGNNSVENCHIHHYSRLAKCYNAAVNITGCGNRIVHNLIHHAPHNAILLSGNDHLIEYNEIHNVVSEVQDAGAFYLGRDWSERGNVVRYNCFHDLYGYGLAKESVAENGEVIYERPRHVWAVYLDDCASGTHVFGNIFYRCALAAVMIGGGKDNVVENNIIVESYPSVHLDARWDQFFFPDTEKGVMTSMTEKLESMNYKQPPYSQRYPDITTTLETPRLPQRNRIVRNVVVYARDDIRGMSHLEEKPETAVAWHMIDMDTASTLVDSNVIWHEGQDVRIHLKTYLTDDMRHIAGEEWFQMGFDQRSVIADPLFVDPPNDNYQLEDDSPAYALGFEPIPMEKIGLVDDNHRATWPVDRHLQPGEIKKTEWTYSVKS